METRPVQNTDKGPTLSLQASGFPISTFREWDESCRKDFGNARWIKIVHDHQMAKVLPLLNSLIVRVEQLEENINNLTTQPAQNEQVKEEYKTIGGIEEK